MGLHINLFVPFITHKYISVGHGRHYTVFGVVITLRSINYGAFEMLILEKEKVPIQSPLCMGTFARFFSFFLIFSMCAYD